MRWLDGITDSTDMGVGDGQGGLACCGSWGCKESDTTERLSWLTERSKDIRQPQCSQWGGRRSSGWQNTYTHTHLKNIFVRERNKQERAKGNTGPREFRVIRKGIAEKMTHEWRRRWGAETRILGRVNSKSTVQSRCRPECSRSDKEASAVTVPGLSFCTCHIILISKISVSVSCSGKLDSVTPWIVARQAPVSMGFPRQEYWSELPFPFPGDLPDPGIEPGFPHFAGRFFTSLILPLPNT